MRVELATLTAPPASEASAASTPPESPVDIALTLSGSSCNSAEQSLETADRRLAAVERTTPGINHGTYDEATRMRHAAWAAMQAHDYVAARALSDKAARLAAALNPE